MGPGREDSRDRPIVEGVLHIRYVPSRRYVQVMVGRHDVEPDSIEVLRPGAVPVEEVEPNEPLRSDPGWRKILDLNQARAEGLVHVTRGRAGGTWEELRCRLDGVVAPLVDAGWRAVREYAEDSWEFGDSVAYELKRGDERIEVELYEDGPIDVWRLEEHEVERNGEPSPPLLKLDFADTEEARREAFSREGWIDPPPAGH